MVQPIREILHAAHPFHWPGDQSVYRPHGESLQDDPLSNDPHQSTALVAVRATLADLWLLVMMDGNGDRDLPLQLAYSSNAYRRCSIEEAIRRIAGIGFRGIELMADEPHLWPANVNDSQVDAVRALLDRHGLTISNINAFMMNAVQDFWHPSWIEPDVEFRRLRVEHTKAALRMARRLGAPSITTEPGGPLPDGIFREHALDRFVAGLEEALKVAEEVGVMLLVEPEPDLLIENADQFFDLSKRIDSPMFGLNFDVGHFYCVSEPLGLAIDRFSSWTAHYHLEDIAETRVHEHLIPGHGAINFKEVVAAIRKSDYNGWLTVELYPYLDDPDAAGREALEFFRKFKIA